MTVYYHVLLCGNGNNVEYKCCFILFIHSLFQKHGTTSRSLRPAKLDAEVRFISRVSH